jgi:hypothetical protein
MLWPAATDQSGSRPVSTSASPAPKIGIRAFGAVDFETVAAPLSFKAVFGKSSFTGFGAGVDVLNVWHHAFLRVSLGRMSASGTRVVVFNGQTVSVGVPITMTMTPIEVGGGWRFGTRKSPQPATPYVGGGLLALKYSEVSTGAISGEDTSATYKGMFLIGGVDLLLMKQLSVGVEADYRSAPNAAGAGGVSKALGESNLGGMTLRILFGIRK